jgi:hypothetical protein
MDKKQKLEDRLQALYICLQVTNDLLTIQEIVNQYNSLNLKYCKATKSRGYTSR